MDALIDDWITAELAESPERATALGIDGSDDRLGDYSAAGFERRISRDDRWLDRYVDRTVAAVAHDPQVREARQEHERQRGGSRGR